MYLWTWRRHSVECHEEVVLWKLRKLGIEEWLVKGVMTMYNNVRTVVTIKDGNSEESKVKVGIHQSLVWSPLLFMVVMNQ